MRKQQEKKGKAGLTEKGKIKKASDGLRRVPLNALPTRERQEGYLLHGMEVRLPSRAAGQAMTSTFSNFPDELSYLAAFSPGLSKIKYVSYM